MLDSEYEDPYERLEQLEQNMMTLAQHLEEMSRLLRQTTITINGIKQENLQCYNAINLITEEVIKLKTTVDKTK
jgi:hypothetical protein